MTKPRERDLQRSGTRAVYYRGSMPLNPAATTRRGLSNRTEGRTGHEHEAHRTRLCHPRDPRYRDAPRDSRAGDHGIAPAHLVGRGVRARGAATPPRPAAGLRGQPRPGRRGGEVPRARRRLHRVSDIDRRSALPARRAIRARRRPRETGRRQRRRADRRRGRAARRGELRRPCTGRGAHQRSHVRAGEIRRPLSRRRSRVLRTPSPARVRFRARARRKSRPDRADVRRRGPGGDRRRRRSGAPHRGRRAAPAAARRVPGDRRRPAPGGRRLRPGRRKTCADPAWNVRRLARARDRPGPRLRDVSRRQQRGK